MHRFLKLQTFQNYLLIMKTTLKIYGLDYEVEIKARDKRNLNASKKATQKVVLWLEARIWEAARTADNLGTIAGDEMKHNAGQIHIDKGVDIDYPL